MDLGIFGIIDIVVILIGVIVLIVGYIKGFMTKMVSLIASIAICSLSIFLSSNLAFLMRNQKIFYPKIYNDLYGKMDGAMQNAKPGDSVSSVIKEAFKTPEVISSFIANKVGENDMAKVSDAVSNYIAMIAMRIIAFLIIFIICMIVFFILMAIIKYLRKNKVVRVCDGILGMILYFAIYSFIISFVFFLLRYTVDHELIGGSTLEFVIKDLQLDNDKFRLSKFIYEGNFFIDFYHLFF